MINWTKDKWEDVKLLLDELEYDYETDFEGNLILHFKSFDIVDENTKKVVDTVEHVWLKFQFSKYNFKVIWSRTDIYASNPNYVHPHVNGTEHCTGDYIRGINLCRDILYYTDYVKHYNSGHGWTTVPSTEGVRVDSDALNKKLVPTFYFDITAGHPMLLDVEFKGDLKTVVKERPLSDPKTFFWKGNKFTQFSKGSRIEHLDLKKYFDYVEYFKRYHHSASTVSDVNALSEIS